MRWAPSNAFESAKAEDEINREIDAGIGVGVESVEDVARNRELRDVGTDLAGHAGRRQRHDTGVDRAVELDAGPPGDDRVEVVGDLHVPGIGVVLPRRHGAQAAGDADADGPRLLLGEVARHVDHGSHREVVGSSSRLGSVAVHEEELLDAVGRRGEQVAPEAEQVAVPGVDARDGAAPHLRDLVGHGDARHGRTTDVVVRYQEAGCDRAEHPDLVADPRQVGPSRRFDLAHHLERIHHEILRTSSS